MSAPLRDHATRRMRVGFERTLERAVWCGCLLLGMVCGFLGGYLVRGRLEPHLVIAPPAIVAAPASYCACPVTSKTSCTEVLRMCYAQKRTTSVAP